MSEHNTPQIALVTGGSRGIGSAISQRLAKDGFLVAVHYGTDLSAATRVVNEIAAAGGEGFAFQSDLGADDPATAFWQSFDHAASALGLDNSVIQVLVNNAGVTLRGEIEKFRSEDFIRQQSINVNAPFFIVQQGLSRIADGGRIINISSGVTRIAFPEIIAYALTKGAINAFTHTLAQHVGSRRITVNAVAPGVVDTDINASWLRDNQEALDAVSASSALGRVGQPDDIARVVAFLASPDSAWVTGQVIDATGGTSL